MAERQLSKHASNKWVILALLATAQFMVVLDISIVNVALPTIARQLHITPSDLQWIITAYTITFGGFLLLGGRAADIYGRRRIFIGAVSAFMLASFLCGLAASDTQIIIVRALQGLCAAIMSPAALSIVLTEFREGKERNAAIGVWAAVAAGGGAAGVLLGGIITQYIGWRWNFFINDFIGAVVIFSALRLLPHHIGEENKKIKLDLVGAAFATAGLMSVVYGLSLAPNHGWSSHSVIGFLIAGVLLLSAFIFNERKVEQPLLPLNIFKIRNVAGGNLTALSVACTLFSMFFFVTLYVQTVLGYSPVRAGLSFLPITFIIAIVSGIVSKLVGKLGHKPFLVAGPLVLSFGLYLLSHMRVHGSYGHDVFPGLSIAALGMGLSFIAMTLAATGGVPKHFSGLASGLLNTAQQVGGAIGLAILSAVYASTFKADLVKGNAYKLSQVHGYASGLHVGMVLALAGAVVALLVIKNEKIEAKEAMSA